MQHAAPGSSDAKASIICRQLRRGSQPCRIAQRANSACIHRNAAAPEFSRSCELRIALHHTTVSPMIFGHRTFRRARAASSPRVIVAGRPPLPEAPPPLRAACSVSSRGLSAAPSAESMRATADARCQYDSTPSATVRWSESRLSSHQQDTSHEEDMRGCRVAAASSGAFAASGA